MAERPPLLPDLFRMVVKMIVGGVLVIGLVSCGVGCVAGAGAGGKTAKKEPVAKTIYGNKDSDNAIERIDIVGPILTHAPDETDGGFFSSIQVLTYGYKVKEQLLKAAKDDDVKAVMLFVSTPGGTIVGSEAIHDGVLAVKEAGKPIVAHVDMMSASGGVWSTAAADKIFADHGSLVGSVGVIFGNFMYYKDPVAIDGGLFRGGVTTRGGVKSTVIAASEGKDLGNPFRPMTEREKTLLEASAKEFYEKFLDHVTQYRPLDRDALVDDYGAMIFANDAAEARGYIDGSRTYQESIAYIAGEIGAEGDDWKLVLPPEVPKSPLEKMFGASLAALSSGRMEAAQDAAVCAELKTGPVAITAQSLTSLCGL
ncbi:S49 family peptidase [Hyphococcus luteus]|nr:S49 family peptidase [Marinicaulis flavus]